MISLDNRAGNKLDQFLPVSRRHHPPSGRRRHRGGGARSSVANLAPDGLPRYVQGPYTVPEFVAGEYKGILTVNIPFVSRDVHLDGVEQDRGRRARTRRPGWSPATSTLLRGQSGTYTLRFTVPKGYEHLEVVPSARYPAIDYTAGARSGPTTARTRSPW